MMYLNYIQCLLEGGTSIKLNPALVSGGDVVFNAFDISQDSTTVVYIADQDIDGVNELYSVPIGGGTSIQLNPVLVSGGDVFRLVISKDSTIVVYVADQDTDGVNELYSVPIGGGTSIKLNPVLVSGGDVVFDTFNISQDSKTVVYVADQDTDGVNELYSVPIGGGTSIKLNPTLVSGGDVSSFVLEISQDSKTVVYVADQDTDDVNELYSVPIGGGTSIKLNSTLVSGGDVSSFVDISSDSTTVVYVADQDTDGVNDLYVSYFQLTRDDKVPHTGFFIADLGLGCDPIIPDKSLS